jgi:pimeloyl-ACP methyl ester carboxylesterase
VAHIAGIHRGYLSRSRGIDALNLYRRASLEGKRLVFGGHSLGGALGILSAITVLETLPEHMHSKVSAVAFASPPFARESLAASILGKSTYKLRNYVIKEDWVPLTMTCWMENPNWSSARPHSLSPAPAKPDTSALIEPMLPTLRRCNAWKHGGRRASGFHSLGQRVFLVSKDSFTIHVRWLHQLRSRLT